MQVNVNGKSAFVMTSERDIDPKLPSILWIHGAAMEANVWASQSRYFAFHGFNSIGVTRPGHGIEGSASYSEGPKNSTVEAEADWLAALLDALSLKSATVVGHSLGGLIALDFAGRYPERTDKVVFVASAPAIPVHPFLLEQSGADEDLADQLIASWGYGRTGHQGGNRTPGGWMLGASLQLLYRQGSKVLHDDLAQCADYQGGEKAAKAITAPTLIIGADGDKMTPLKTGGRVLNQLIADSQLIEFENTGHMIQVERPERTLQAMKAFLL